ncbi:class I SAM-dependent methyltransferase [Ligilactobacillus saerimneri]|uniref:class I SAM-dependent methyltransferase n=1 Tax=Ligilactobacillus saerimneri TaxID=228229 RepID=UPI0024B145F3|nr:methyltransferase domain-containing protein [Ligilactobacillus saerimneri]MDI9206389.1 methyltransferase domain-containing protein [Ligilactobacillus saerimneri]
MVLCSAATYWHTTTRGKYQIGITAIKRLAIKPTDQVLDLGTGHGFLLLEVAKYLRAPGQVARIDIWSQKDQSRNSLQATQNNIKVAEVDAVATVKTADILNLPFTDQSFDKIVTSFALHNLKTKAQRKQALQEALRVLKPGGKLLIIDLIFGKEYQTALTDMGVSQTTCRGAGFNGWWGGSWMMTTIVTATKNE